MKQIKQYLHGFYNCKFMDELIKVRSLEIFLGIARLLNIDLKEDLNFNQVVERIIYSYGEKPLKLKKQIYRLVKNANLDKSAPKEVHS